MSGAMFLKMSKLLHLSIFWNFGRIAIKPYIIDKVNSEPASCTPHVFYAYGHKVLDNFNMCQYLGKGTNM